MVEVFRTNVRDRELAAHLVDQIHHSFAEYRANFDLEDCDHILRVKSGDGLIESNCLIHLLRDLGCHAEVLEDELPLLQVP